MSTAVGLLPPPGPLEDELRREVERPRPAAWMWSVTGAVLPLSSAPYLGAPSRGGPRTVAVTATGSFGYRVWTADGRGHGFGEASSVAGLAGTDDVVTVMEHAERGRLRLRSDGEVVGADGAGGAASLPPGDVAVALVDRPGGGLVVVTRSGLVCPVDGGAAPEVPALDGEVVAAVPALPGGLFLVTAWRVVPVGEVALDYELPAPHLLGGPVTGAVALAGGAGLWLVTAQGGVHGPAGIPFPGSLPTSPRDRVAGITPTPAPA